MSSALILTPKTVLHEPLDPEREQIRLFRLQIRSDHGKVVDEAEVPQLRGTLEVFDLDNCPRYQALSYTWGNPDTSYTVIINGRYFFISRNLHDFLQTFPQTTPSLLNTSPFRSYLWIDQICIDQGNVRKRNSQVRLMKHIYPNASRVIAWLGPYTDQAYLEKMARVQANVEQQRELNALSRTRDEQGATDVDESTSLRRPQYPDSDRRFREFYSAICDRDYWNRLWIIQELLLAQDIVICFGARSLSWDALDYETINRADVSEPRRVRKYSIRTGTPNFVTTVRFWRVLVNVQQDQKLSLNVALHFFSHSLCSDPRDKVYGLLGIVDDADDLRVDYSLDEGALLAEVTLLFVKQAIGQMTLEALKEWQDDRPVVHHFINPGIEILAETLEQLPKSRWFELVDRSKSFAGSERTSTNITKANSDREADYISHDGSSPSWESDTDRSCEEDVDAQACSVPEEDPVDELESFMYTDSDRGDGRPPVYGHINRWADVREGDGLWHDIDGRCRNLLEKEITFLESEEYKLAMEYILMTRSQA